jgi:hypothetical protein
MAQCANRQDLHLNSAGPKVPLTMEELIVMAEYLDSFENGKEDTSEP